MLIVHMWKSYDPATGNGRLVSTYPEEARLNCFVIMPFQAEFEDVHEAIKAAVRDAKLPTQSHCFRLDENRPAGRITDRLVREIRGASLCIADLTGTRPNVMWEVGFAMALGCPTVIVTQGAVAELPFDIQGMQSIQYVRTQLSATLSRPLTKVVEDTLRERAVQKPPQQDGSELIGELLAQVADLKNIVTNAVQSWNPPVASPKERDGVRPSLRMLEGAWISEEVGTHLYARLIGEDLVVAYCYRDDTHLTGVYYGWRRVGEYWFARYAWLGDEPSPRGFAFLRDQSDGVLQGAWWSDESGCANPAEPPRHAGVRSVWRRLPNKRVPQWAEELLDDVVARGLDSRLPPSLAINGKMARTRASR